MASKDDYMKALAQAEAVADFDRRDPEVFMDDWEDYVHKHTGPYLPLKETNKVREFLINRAYEAATATSPSQRFANDLSKKTGLKVLVEGPLSPLPRSLEDKGMVIEYLKPILRDQDNLAEISSVVRQNPVDLSLYNGDWDEWGAVRALTSRALEGSGYDPRTVYYKQRVENSLKERSLWDVFFGPETIGLDKFTPYYKGK